MNTTTLLARHVEPGMKIALEDGTFKAATVVRRAGWAKVNGPKGTKPAYAIEIMYGNEWTLAHPLDVVTIAA